MIDYDNQKNAVPGNESVSGGGKNCTPGNNQIIYELAYSFCDKHSHTHAYKAVNF